MLERRGQREGARGHARPAPANRIQRQRHGVPHSLHVVDVDLVPGVGVRERRAHLARDAELRGRGGAHSRQLVDRPGEPLGLERPVGVEIGDQAPRWLLAEPRPQILGSLALVHEGAAEAPVPSLPAERAAEQRLAGLLEERGVGIVDVELVGGAELALERDPPEVVVDGVVAVARQGLAVDGDHVRALDDVGAPERDLAGQTGGGEVDVDVVARIEVLDVELVVDGGVGAVRGLRGTGERVAPAEQVAERLLEGLAAAQARSERPQVEEEQRAVLVVHEQARVAGGQRPVHLPVVAPLRRAGGLVEVVEAQHLDVGDRDAAVVHEGHRRIVGPAPDRNLEGAGVDALPGKLVEVLELELARGGHCQAFVEVPAPVLGLGQQAARGSQELHGDGGNRVDIGHRIAADLLEGADAVPLRVHRAPLIRARQPLLAGDLALEPDHLEGRSVDVVEDLVVAVGPGLEALEAAAHRDRAGAEIGGAVGAARRGFS